MHWLGRPHLLYTGLKLLYSFMLSGITLTGYARVELLDDRNGLTSNIVRDIVKDNAGFMWIGTSNGLNIYDGYTFTRFRALGARRVTQLMYDDKRDIVWVALERGLYALSGQQRNPLPVKMDGEELGPVKNMTRMKDGQVYVLLENGDILTVDDQRNASVFVHTKPFLRKPSVSNVYNLDVFSDSVLFFMVNDGHGVNPFYLLHTGTKQVEPIPWKERIRMLPISVRKSGDTFVIATPGQGILLMDVYTGNLFESPVLQKMNVSGTSDFGMRYGKYLYAGFANGHLYRADLVQGAVEEISKEIPSLSGSYNRHHCIFRDEQGIIWIGTNKGIFKIYNDTKPFKHLLLEQPSLSIRGISEDRSGDLYVGTYKGLYHFDRKAEQWAIHRYLVSTDKSMKIIPYGMLNDEDSGYVYIASESGFFYRFNKRLRKMEYDFYDTRFVDYMLFGYSVFMDDDGLIWIGSTRGLFLYDRNEGTVKPYMKDAARLGKLSVRQIAGSREKNVCWIATTEGVFKIDKYKGILRHLNDSSMPALSKNHTHFVSEDHRGRIWIGTNGGGINIVSPDMDQVTYLNREQHGLVNNIVYGMLWPDTGQVWISTFGGLSNYNLHTGTFTNYGTSDGLVSEEFNQGSYMKDSRGFLFFGSPDGICYFHPDSMRSYTHDFSLFVSASSVPGRKLTGNGDTILIYPSDFSFTVSFGLSDYRAPLYNRFLYRIRGLSDEWIPIYGNPELKIPDLAPGHYTLEVKGMNAYGHPAQNILVFHLDSRVYFYKTWWFYFLLFLLAGSLLWLFFMIRLRSIRRMQQLRVQIASDLHDEVGGLLTRIVLFSDNLSEGNDPPDKQKEKLEKIAELGRDATMSMNDILWAIDARNDFAGSLADRMREYAEQMLTPANIIIRFTTSGIDHKQNISTQVRQNLYMIFKEALNNIVKHSSATEVDIRYRHDRAGFFLSVTNNGNDGEERPKLSGQGLRNMHMRAEKIGAHISYDQQEGIFTLVVEKGTKTGA